MASAFAAAAIGLLLSAILVLLVVGGKDGYVSRDGQLVNPEEDGERRASFGR